MILVRHAESEWNRHFSRTRIDPGIRDPVLTDVGRRARAFRDKCERLADRAELAVITHWGFIRALTGHEVANAAYVRLT